MLRSRDVPLSKLLSSVCGHQPHLLCNISQRSCTYHVACYAVGRLSSHTPCTHTHTHTHMPFTSKLSIPMTPASYRVQAQRGYACALVWDTYSSILLQLLWYNKQMFSVNTCEDLHESHNAETACRFCCTTSRCTLRSMIRGSCRCCCQLCSITLTSEYAVWTQRLGWMWSKF